MHSTHLFQNDTDFHRFFIVQQLYIHRVTGKNFSIQSQLLYLGIDLLLLKSLVYYVNLDSVEEQTYAKFSALIQLISNQLAEPVR